MTRASRWLAGSLALGVILCAGSVAAQPRSPAAIRQQIEASLGYQQKAMSALEDRDRALKLAGEAYARLKAAHSSMTVNASSAKFHDPLFPLTNQKVEQALAQLQRAMDALKARNPSQAGGDPIEVTRRSLMDAIQITQLTLATAF